MREWAGLALSVWRHCDRKRIPWKRKRRPPSVKEGFHLNLLDRKRCLMYPEDKLGGFINSASAQWQVVDALFQGMREIMRSGTTFTSRTFSIAWTNACQNSGSCVFYKFCVVNLSLTEFFFIRNLQNRIQPEEPKPKGPTNA